MKKIYTGTGDHGRTSLFSGERVPKSHARVQAYGAVDELNSCLGALAAAIPAKTSGLKNQVHRIQSELFQVGAWLATTPGAPETNHLETLTGATERLENAIDQMQAELTPLNDFILPGGHPAAAWSHVARSVCRRTERWVAGLLQHSSANGAPPASLQQVLIYLNRLSDYLFVLARALNRAAGVTDAVWEK
jgi:cob(I)alamin adenosyltransferase